MFHDSIIALQEHYAFLIISGCAFIFLGWFSWILLLKNPTSKQQPPPLPPGPKPLPLVGNLLSLRPDLHAHFADLSQVHGPIFTVWLGRKVGIVVTSPALARAVLKDHDAAFANRDVPAAGREATYGGRDIVWTPHGAEWRMLRKICVREMLGSSALDSLRHLRRLEVRRAERFFHGQAGQPVNIGEQMFLTVLNVITAMIWGGTVTAGERIGLEFREIVGEMSELLGFPNVSDFYPNLARFDLQGVCRNMKALVAKLDGIFETVIDRRLGMEDGEKKGNKDFLQVLLELKDSEGDEKTPFTITHLKAVLMDMVVGGTETTANTLEFAMAEIMKQPEVLTKLRDELDNIVGRDNIVEESHIHHLPYLQAVMRETLRLHPALPLLVPHCPSETRTVGGYAVPKGTRVFVNVWAIQRDPRVWENPLEFRPERFLEGDKKWDFSGRDFEYLPFGSGRRICAGVGSAERMFIYALATMIHSFDWNLPGDAEELELSEKFGIVLKKRVPLVLIPTPRLSPSRLYE
ncbi:unnamed protein product [Cuscuta campestris]|uniref:Uncharacterized protein n=1 Tax=Cuscuta campestris TaxID=132261 RepID=A0A484MIV3_9ASTE|nr:unnamed protein product [Cuscuta campestris]